VEASASVVPILVDCTQAGAHQGTLERYRIRGFPTLLLVGPDGEALGQPQGRDADSIVRLMNPGARTTGESGRDWTGLLVLAAIAISVPCALVFVYKKWLAGERSPDE
jgi:hypothetical protein